MFRGFFTLLLQYREVRQTARREGGYNGSRTLPAMRNRWTIALLKSQNTRERSTGEIISRGDSIWLSRIPR